MERSEIRGPTNPFPVSLRFNRATCYLDIYEGALDEAQFTAWVKQAAALPGEKL